MVCPEVIKKLDSYLGCELSEIEEYNIRKHLSKCNICRMEYEEMESIFLTLSAHEMMITPGDFTDNVLSRINVYEKDKNLKEVFFIKGIASIVAAGLISTAFNAAGYRPINLFSQIYRGSVRINRVVVDPVDKLFKEVREIKEIADVM